MALVDRHAVKRWESSSTGTRRCVVGAQPLQLLGLMADGRAAVNNQTLGGMPGHAGLKIPRVRAASHQQATTGPNYGTFYLPVRCGAVFTLSS